MFVSYYQTGHFSSFTFWAYLYIFLTVFALVTGLISLNTRLVYKHQTLFTWLFTIVVFLVTLCFVTIGYAMVTNNSTSELVYITVAKIFVPCSAILFLVSAGINYYLLKQRLKVGFSESRTLKNYAAVSGIYGKVGFGAALGVTLIGGILARSINAALAIGLSILFLSAFPSVIIEFGYLAYLKGKDKRYWEQVSEPREKTPEEKRAIKRAILLKLPKWIYIIASIIFIYVTDKIYTGEMPLVIRIVARAILISWLILFVLWLMKKIQTRKKNKK